jgi:hypothetical protein
MKDKIATYTVTQQVEAVQWTGHNLKEVVTLFGEGHNVRIGPDYFIIPTYKGEMRADIGDYIFRTSRGEVFPCHAGIFEGNYILSF